MFTAIVTQRSNGRVVLGKGYQLMLVLVFVESSSLGRFCARTSFNRGSFLSTSMWQTRTCLHIFSLAVDVYIQINFGIVERTAVGFLGEDTSSPLPCTEGKYTSAENGPVRGEPAHSYA